MKFHYYLITEDNRDYIIRVSSRRKPVKRKKSYIVQEPSHECGHFVMTCFPEISYENLSQMKYIGKSK